MVSSAGPRAQGRSSFAAAFLSFVFPGLGQAYAGVWPRALGFAAAPLLLLSLLAGLVVHFRPEQLLALGVQPIVLVALLVLLVVGFVYRVAAIVDAYRVTSYLNGTFQGRDRRASLGFQRLSMAGLLAVILVTGVGHAGLAWFDLQSLDLVTTVFGGSGDPTIHTPPSASVPATAPGQGGQPTAAAPTSSASPWNGTDRLNILLVGVDQRSGDQTFNTDTLILVSVDPATRQVAMFSLPRDTVDVPLPPIPARSVYGATYGGKINGLWTAARSRPDLFPGGGFAALKQTIGYLYRLDVQYYVEVNFDGFRKVVDALGGVTINVQAPVVDDNYPGDNGLPQRIYIPAGIQHMTGAQALIYARSRHASNDFDRAARQQRVLLSLRQQADFGRIITNFSSLTSALKSAVHTDIPTDKLSDLITLAEQVNSANIHSFVFAPPLYQREVLSGDPRGYVIIPYVSKIRAAVASAFQFDPKEEARREAVAAENARVWVLNGTGQRGQAGQIAAYLQSRGVAAVAPNQPPSGRTPVTTRIEVYNGAGSKLPATLALLQSVFGVTATPVTDPSVNADIVITTAPNTPKLSPPPAQ